jgi:hypothetical protein
MSAYKEYIGDAVYADYDGYSIVLTTEDGISASNRIVLEPQVFRDLVRYAETLSERLKREATA